MCKVGSNWVMDLVSFLLALSPAIIGKVRIKPGQLRHVRDQTLFC